MASKFTNELIIGALLLVTVMLMAGNHWVERTTTFTPAVITSIEAADDRQIGGNSKSQARIIENKFRFDFDVDSDSHATPFACVLLNPDGETLMDLSWADQFDITIKSGNPAGQAILLYVRNYEPTVTEKDDNTSRKYNETLVTATNEMTTITIQKDEFYVPTWWKERFDVATHASYPSFKNVEWFELSTHGDVGTGYFEIESIQCRGHWLETATLNQFLLWSWMGGGLMTILYRMSKLKRKLNEKTASAMQLLEHNNLLMSKSATYRELARRDSLTGLLNRYGLEGRFEELSKTDDLKYTLILFDLDKFKQINDSYGHCYGDRVLFDVARIVKSRINSVDAIARWGGDEFLVVLTERNANQAAEFAEEIRSAVELSDLNYTCSFGISQLKPGGTFEETLHLADGALYDSKDDGRNAINVYQQRGSDRRTQRSDDSAPPTMPTIPTEPSGGEFTVFE